MNKKLLLSVLTIFSVAVHAAPCIISSGNSPAERSAAGLLTEYIGKLTGKSMEVKLNGMSPIMFKINIDKMPDAAPDSWKIRTEGNSVILSGGNGRGVIYAVAHLLEDHCGVFLYSPYEEFVPAGKVLELSEISAQGVPFFRYRHIYRSSHLQDEGRFAMLSRLNNDDTGKIMPRFGGVVGFGPPRFVHTMWSYVPEQKYFASHPEYFSLVNGKRRAGRESQLCMTNPDLPEVIYAQLKEYIRQGDQSATGRKTEKPLFYDISINDNKNFCHCEKCAAFVKEHEQSGLLLHLLNPVAEKLKAERPELFITTLAYDFTDDPPRGIRPAENLIIRLCPKINMMASILEPDNAGFRKQLAGWAAVSKNLFIWDYAETYIKGGSGMPFASEIYYGDRYRFYAENQVKGIMWEHPFEPEADLYEMKFYLETRLMEDPKADVNVLSERFVNSYYGKAGTEILKSRKLLDASRRRSKASIRFMSTPDEFQFFTNEELRAMQACYDRAEASVSEDEVFLLRVRRARRGLDRICVFRALPPVDRKNSGKSVAYDRDLTQKAMNRLRESWLTWLARYPEKAELCAAAENEMNQYEMVMKGSGKVPEKFAGQELYDFTAVRFQNHDLKAVKIVVDPESEAGYGAKITVAANEEMYAPPFVMGFRNRVDKTTVNVKLPGFPEESGYHWYRLGTFTLPLSADIFLSRSWGIKLHLSRFPEKRPLEFWVSIKFTGPMFRKNDSGENAIYIDRIVALPQKKQ